MRLGFLILIAVILSGCGPAAVLLVGNPAALVETATPAKKQNTEGSIADAQLCRLAISNGKWDVRPDYLRYVQEAKRRRLDCELVVSYERMDPAQLCGKVASFKTRDSAQSVIKARKISCDTASMLEARVELGDRKAMIKLGGYKIRGTGTLGYKDISKGITLIARGNSTNPENILVTCRSAIKKTQGNWEWVAGHDGSRVRDEFGLLIDDCLAIIEGYDPTLETSLASVSKVERQNSLADRLPERCTADMGATRVLEIGRKYRFGVDNKSNPLRAIQCFNMAGILGKSEGYRQVGEMYDVGSGVSKNGIQARKYHQLAADMGSRVSINWLKVRHGIVVGEKQIAGTKSERSNIKRQTPEVGSEKMAVELSEVNALKERLARLEAEKDSKQLAISQDTQIPIIRITSVNSDGARGTISGVATDNTGIAEVLVDGQAVPLDSSGRFSTSTFIPSSGIDIQITAYDLKGLSTTETIRLERTKRTQQVSRLAKVNPLIGPKQKPSRDRAALIIGLEKYAVAQPAQFASRDAQMFADYAREKLGIPAGNVKVLTDSGASEREILTALKVWLPTAVKPDTTDLYVFYAGHGMPTADGSSAYLVPYDGDVRLLEDTAISRKRFFDEIGAVRPRSATFFFDNCYSGATRSEELLLASRPLGIKVQETDVPENYLVFTAGESNQTAGVLEEVKHGRFSYFVFKGLEGEADANADGKISAGELHSYVRESVGRFSAGAQTPTMLGDGSRWVVR